MTSEATIRPFEIRVPETAITDLRTRLANTRWPRQLPGEPWCRGVPVDYLQKLAAYWAGEFDWRDAEHQLNGYPQFVTEIDGQTFHFLHVRSPEPEAMPLVLLHGWPGSFIEFLDVIGPLADPARHGLDPKQAFHLVIPSLAGFGFSTPLASPGWTSARNAAALIHLMDALGYRRYGVQGGDYGAFVAPDMGRAAPDHVIGVHVNAATFGFIPLGPVSDGDTQTMTPVEKQRVQRLEDFNTEMSGYFQQQSTRPQTLGYGLTDSPAGQLAWIVEKFKEWTDAEHELPQDAVAIDRILTNVSLYWFTETAASSANLYYESAHSRDWPRPSQVPTGVAAFAQDVAIRRFAEQNNNIVHWSDFDTGGHFAALETPDLLVSDIRQFFAGLR
jgi:pimeloyl-ACP methyl ester carboxylesterase